MVVLSSNLVFRNANQALNSFSAIITSFQPITTTNTAGMAVDFTISVNNRYQYYRSLQIGYIIFVKTVYIPPNLYNYNSTFFEHSFDNPFNYIVNSLSFSVQVTMLDPTKPTFIPVNEPILQVHLNINRAAVVQPLSITLPQVNPSIL